MFDNQKIKNKKGKRGREREREREEGDVTHPSKRCNLTSPSAEPEITAVLSFTNSAQKMFLECSVWTV